MTEQTVGKFEWNPAEYLKFDSLRLRPAMDLLAGVPDLPAGDMVDLGCGTGVMGAALSARFPDRALIGLDASATMLDKARASGGYSSLVLGDVTLWAPEKPPALIFSNALLQWLPEHVLLFPKLANHLAPGGTLAIQMPRQLDEPSHELLRRLSSDMFPDRFDGTGELPPLSTPANYARLLEPLGTVRIWETIYYQRLPRQPEGHPVRAFTCATAGRPILEQLSDTERADFLSAYDSALTWAYPAEPTGEVIFPFRRLFLTLTLPR